MLALTLTGTDEYAHHYPQIAKEALPGLATL